MICELSNDEMGFVSGGMDFSGRRVSTNVEFHTRVGPLIVISDYQGDIIGIIWA